MRKIILILAVMGFTKLNINAQNTSSNDTLQYLVMRVNNAILDCPHFGGFFARFIYENHWYEIEKNLKEKYVIYGLRKEVEYDPYEKFDKYLNTIHFPKDVIVSLERKSSLKEVNEFIKK
jgi:hypothetical protein